MSSLPPSPPAGSPGAAPSAKKAMDFAADSDWPGYFAAVANKGPRETLVKAVSLFEREHAAGGPGTRGAAPTVRSAIDLGCGEGRDTRELLARAGPPRWEVLATDWSQEGLDLLRASLGPTAEGRVTLERGLLEDVPRAYAAGVRLPSGLVKIGSLDLVNASFCLPFCKPEALPGVIAWIEAALRPGGRFAGQIFGERDTWAHARKTSGIRRSEVDRLFQGFVFEELREEEKDDRTTMGEDKHWHVFHIVARKRDDPRT